MSISKAIHLPPVRKDTGGHESLLCKICRCAADELGLSRSLALSKGSFVPVFGEEASTHNEDRGGVRRGNARRTEVDARDWAAVRLLLA